MKKFPFFLAALLSVCCLTSCLEDEGNTAKATCQYFGLCENITFKVEDDTLLRELILESLDNLKITGEPSLFKEDAEVDVNSVQAAYLQCDIQALTTYGKRLENLERINIKNDIFVHHSDSLTELGYPTADALPLDSITLTINLYNASGSDPMKVYTLKR